MAGAGEACSHIAALMYAVMTKAKLQNEVACTSVLCKWPEPSQSNESSLTYNDAYEWVAKFLIPFFHKYTDPI